MSTKPPAIVNLHYKTGTPGAALCCAIFGVTFLILAFALTCVWLWLLSPSGLQFISILATMKAQVEALDYNLVLLDYLCVPGCAQLVFLGGALAFGIAGLALMAKWIAFSPSAGLSMSDKGILFDRIWSYGLLNRLERDWNDLHSVEFNGKVNAADITNWAAIVEFFRHD